MERGKYNLRNPAVKRIVQEVKELQKDPSPDFMAAALEDNIFEWHFAVRGPPDTEFEGGIFHGRILLPPEYPFKPPSFLMLSPNGRFETGVKICLSISSHHPEHWQPSWSVRTALTALTAFFPTPGNGAIGSLDYTKEERAALAKKSREQPPVFGSPDRQRVTDEVHAAMLAAEASQARVLKPAGPGVSGEDCRSAEPEGTASAPAAQASPKEPQQPPVSPAITASGDPVADSCSPMPDQPQRPKQQQPQPEQATEEEPAEASDAPVRRHNSLLGEVDEAVSAIAAQPPAGAAQTWEDLGLTLAAGVLVILIAAILFRRILVITGADITSLM